MSGGKGGHAEPCDAILHATHGHFSGHKTWKASSSNTVSRDERNSLVLTPWGFIDHLCRDIMHEQAALLVAEPRVKLDAEMDSRWRPRRLKEYGMPRSKSTR